MLVPSDKLMVGQKIGRLTILSRADNRHGKAYWNCQCDCTNTRVVSADGLRSGKSQSCGCLAVELTMRRAKNLAGQRFGKLVAIERRRCSGGQIRWLCQCDCGNTTNVSTYGLTSGRATACRCKRLQRVAELTRTHGETVGGIASKEFKAWAQMINRCTNTNAKEYRHYGGRGITICQRWLSNFSNFLDDMGRSHSPIHSLDRIDVNGNYQPENCRWATQRQQVRNTRLSLYVEIDGEHLHITDAAEKLGIKYATALYRYHQGIPLTRKLWSKS